MMPFSIARLPRIEFGAGVFAKIPALAASFGTRALLVTGGASLLASRHWPLLIEGLRKNGITYHLVQARGEPTPHDVDTAARQWKTAAIDVVIGIGGGSVLDAAKAIAGLLRVDHSVMDYLEGVGPELPYQGPSVPFIAAPTTAGTGSEATKNAVLSVQGPDGFKKSFRHEMLVPHYAVVDPELLATCPRELIAANGMDALTQLLESYVSVKANPVTDALAWSGIECARDGLLEWYHNGAAAPAPAAHGRMAYAALMSGITLAQTGLGSVHGLASPLGAFFPIPHGVVCGTLVAAATQVNIEALRAREPNSSALHKYARVAALLCKKEFSTPASAHAALVALLHDWTRQMNLPLLREYGVNATDVARIVRNSRGSSMKTNPIVLSDEEIARVVQERL